MNEQEIMTVLGCPPDRTLEEHLKSVKKALDAKSREEICVALKMLNGFEPKGKLGEDRQRVASAVHMNPEWITYVLDTMDNIRNSSLVNEDSDILKGRLLALSDAYKFFKNYSNISTKPREEGDN